MAIYFLFLSSNCYRIILFIGPIPIIFFLILTFSNFADLLQP